MNREIMLFDGSMVDPLGPPILRGRWIESIAHALANKCRFTGHCRTFCSIAEHSVLCAQWALREPIRSHSSRQRLAREMLLHDVGEAFLPDIAAPIKGAFLIEPSIGMPIPFNQVEDRWRNAVRGALELPEIDSRDVNDIVRLDRQQLADEASRLFPSFDGRWGMKIEPRTDEEYDAAGIQIPGAMVAYPPLVKWQFLELGTKLSLWSAEECGCASTAEATT